MKDYRKTKTRFFLTLSARLSLTGARISFIIYSALTKTVGENEYKTPLACSILLLVFVILTLVLGLTDLIYRSVRYFKKPDIKIRREKATAFIQYQILKDGASLRYKDYFLGRIREEKKNRISLSLSSFYLLLASVAVAIHPRTSKSNAFFLILLLLAIVLLLFLAVDLFLLPLIRLKKASPRRKEEIIEVDSSRLVISDKKQSVSYDYSYRDNAKETKDSFLFIYASQDGLLITIKKDGRKEETKAFLSQKAKEIRKKNKPF